MWTWTQYLGPKEKKGGVILTVLVQAEGAESDASLGYKARVTQDKQTSNGIDKEFKTQMEMIWKKTCQQL